MKPLGKVAWKLIKAQSQNENLNNKVAFEDRNSQYDARKYTFKPLAETAVESWETDKMKISSSKHTKNSIC